MATTKENLAAGFAGESEARNKYTFYAKIARKEGYHYIAKIFEETAENEKRHANDQFKMLGLLGDTAANLQAALDGETYETESMYPTFAKDAEAEGNRDAAALFTQIAIVEKHHADRYKTLLEMVQAGTVWKRDEPIDWKCGVCGRIHNGTEPPAQCPCCKHPREHFEPADLSIC